MPSPAPRWICECGHGFESNHFTPWTECSVDGCDCNGYRESAELTIAAAGSSVPDTSGQPETVEGGHVNVPRGFQGALMIATEQAVAAEAEVAVLTAQLDTALKLLAACSSHLTTLGREDLAPFPDATICPRCDGQTYDRGSCGLCRNIGWLDCNGEALCITES